MFKLIRNLFSKKVESKEVEELVVVDSVEWNILSSTELFKKYKSLEKEIEELVENGEDLGFIIDKTTLGLNYLLYSAEYFRIGFLSFEK